MNEHERVTCRRCKKPVDAIEAVDVFDTPNTFTVRAYCHGEVEQRTINVGRPGLAGVMLAKALYGAAFKEKTS